MDSLTVRLKTRRSSSITDEELLALQGEFLGLSKNGEQEINTEEIKKNTLPNLFQLWILSNSFGGCLRH